MLQVIQNIFLSDAFIFFVLFAMFALFSAYALLSLGELAGYGLGWLLALFFMTVYASVAGADSVGQAVMMDKIRLNLVASVLTERYGGYFGRWHHLCFAPTLVHALPASVKSGAYHRFRVNHHFLHVCLWPC